MKRDNYLKLRSTFEAYEDAQNCRYKYPDNDEYAMAEVMTYNNFIYLIRDILWDEAPEDLKENNPYNPELDRLP